MKLLHVVGARPNFMKAAPVIHAIKSRTEWDQVLVHTGQHYDHNMSDVFFRQLCLPQPDINIGVGSGSHAQQTAEVMIRFEQILLQERPQAVVVYGDVNSTMAAALVAAKLHTFVVHVEAGLRSFDRAMPEEINRIVIDSVADLLLTPSEDANENLQAEGVAPAKISLVGNVMIDTLVRLLPEARALWTVLSSKLGLPLNGNPSAFFGLATLHRPSNVDDSRHLRNLLDAFGDIAAEIPIIFPVHPRTRSKIEQMKVDYERLLFIEPLGYLEFLALQERATFVITDSGGIQEETTFLGIPCLTMRKNTERPVTVTVGTNMLLGQDSTSLIMHVRNVLSGKGKKGSIPPLWDGHASDRVANALRNAL